MANATKSGRITLEDYENLILTSLRRSGIQIDWKNIFDINCINTLTDFVSI